jgi:hypothetical protein
MLCAPVVKEMPLPTSVRPIPEEVPPAWELPVRELTAEEVEEIRALLEKERKRDY